MGAKNVVITGVQIKNKEVLDFVLEGNKKYYITDKKNFKNKSWKWVYSFSSSIVCNYKK